MTKTPDNATDIKVGHKTPDEIKNGLADNIPVHYHLGDLEPRLTPLMMVDLEDLHADALALVQQLERDKAWAGEMSDMLREENNRLEAQNAELLKKIEQLQAERDAAVETIYEMAKCITEDVCEWCDGVECERLCMMHLTERPGFKWRGVQKEE